MLPGSTCQADKKLMLEGYRYMNSQSLSLITTKFESWKESLKKGGAFLRSFIYIKMCAWTNI